MTLTTLEASRAPEAVAVGIRGLTVRAGKQILLENATASFRAGEVTLIVGRSGVGKSVLLRILAGLIESSADGLAFEGTVSFHRGQSEQAVATPRVGVVFQNFAIFDELSPTANVQFARDHRAPATHSTDTPADLLDELNVPRDVPSARLSGGQRQRLAIARTLAYDPDVLLYDEPTSGLDPATAAEVAKLIGKTYATHPKTSIIVTHDFDPLCAIADRVYLVDPASRSLREIPRDQWSSLRELFESTRAKSSSGGEVPNAAATGRALLSRGGSEVGRWLEITSRVAEETLLLPMRLLPLWRSPRWGMRMALHYFWLVAGPSAWAYMAIAGAIIGFVTTYFTFRFLPYANYTEPLLIDDLLASIGFSLYRILVPVLATILIAARCGAALASDVGGKQYGQQIDALRTFGARPTRYLLTGMLYAMLIGTPVLEWIAYQVASFVSLLVFTFTHAGYGPEYWRLHYHRELIEPFQTLFRGSGWLLAKTLTCAVGVTLVAFFQGMQPKSSTRDVSRGITSTILWATLYVLVVHFTFSFLEFD